MSVPALAPAADRCLFRGYRFPPEVIVQAVWLYFRFHLSLRDVQNLLAERGLVVSHESIRQWCDTFGPIFAAGLRKRRAQSGDKWHCDEVLLKIMGKRYWLWRAVDQHGIVLDILVQERRDQAAAEAFLRRVLTSCEGAVPRVIVTDKLASYVPAMKRVLLNTEHRRHKGLNNRAENSHLAVRKRERTLQRLKSKEHAQRFLGLFSAVGNCFRPRRHRLSASEYRQIRKERSLLWREVPWATFATEIRPNHSASTATPAQKVMDSAQVDSSGGQAPRPAAVISTSQRVVRGTTQAIGAVLEATATGTGIQTAYIERLTRPSAAIWHPWSAGVEPSPTRSRRWRPGCGWSGSATTCAGLTTACACRLLPGAGGSGWRGHQPWRRA